MKHFTIFILVILFEMKQWESQDIIEFPDHPPRSRNGDRNFHRRANEASRHHVASEQLTIHVAHQRVQMNIGLAIELTDRTLSAYDLIRLDRYNGISVGDARYVFRVGLYKRVRRFFEAAYAACYCSVFHARFSTSSLDTFNEIFAGTKAQEKKTIISLYKKFHLNLFLSGF